MVDLVIAGRWAPKCSDFFDICMESYKNFQKSKTELQKIKRKKFTKKAADEFDNVTAELHHHSASTVVSAALFLEAFIYDYAAANFSDTYTIKYLDKLSLVSKWAVIPKLVTGKDFPTEGQAFEHLVKLHKARNSLVHYKSVPLPDNIVELERVLEKMEKEDEANVVNAYQTVKEVLTELRKLEVDGEWNIWFRHRAAKS